MKALLCFAMAAVAALSVGCSHTPQQRADRAYYKALNRIAGPTEMRDGIFIIASYSKALNAEKVFLIRRANEFCAEKGLKAYPLEINVVDRRTSLKTAVQVVESIPVPAGNIEMTFRCEKQ